MITFTLDTIFCLKQIMLPLRKPLKYFGFVIILIICVMLIDLYKVRRKENNHKLETISKRTNEVEAVVPVQSEIDLPAILREVDKYLESTVESSINVQQKTKQRPNLKLFQNDNTLQINTSTSKSTSTSTLETRTTDTKTKINVKKNRANLKHSPRRNKGAFIEWEYPKQSQEEVVKLSPRGWSYKGPDYLRCKVQTIGCFVPANGTDKHAEMISSNMTDWICVEYCSRKAQFRIVFAVIRNGNECLCHPVGYRLEKYNMVDDNSKCNVPCSGDPSLNCGGENNLSMVYRILAKCSPAPGPTRMINRQSLLGCYWRPPNFETFMEVYTIDAHPAQMAAKCLLLCEKQGLIIAVPVRPGRCYCGLTTKSFDLQDTKEASYCKTNEKDYVTVYRTLSEDRRCGSRRFLKKDEFIKRVGLVTFPGSGNTWLRYLIESATGLYTGSRYVDYGLVSGGYMGELLSKYNDKLAVVKSHLPSDIKNTTWFSAIINVYRSPYDAMLSEFNRRMSRGHTDAVDSEHFDEKVFQKLILGAFSHKWRITTEEAIKSKLPKLIIAYDDVVKEPIKYTEKMARFILGDKVNEEDLQNRLLCLQLASTGEFKRKKKPLSFDPYPNEAKLLLNEQIERLASEIKNSGLQPMPDYTRPLSNR